MFTETSVLTKATWGHIPESGIIDLPPLLSQSTLHNNEHFYLLAQFSAALNMKEGST
jgi:hypothetical protein